jgi:putative addiction module CopG family antidote
MKISLSPEVERLIEEKLRTGHYRSADEIVREGLELLQERENQEPPPSNHTGDLTTAFKAITDGLPDAEWETVPADFSKNVDRYLYGGPKIS